MKFVYKKTMIISSVTLILFIQSFCFLVSKWFGKLQQQIWENLYEVCTRWRWWFHLGLQSSAWRRLCLLSQGYASQTNVSVFERSHFMCHSLILPFFSKSQDCFYLQKLLFIMSNVEVRQSLDLKLCPTSTLDVMSYLAECVLNWVTIKRMCSI